MATLAKVAAQPNPATIAGVLARLEEIEAALPRGDGVAWFTRLYLAVTRAVDGAAPKFHDERFLTTLDVVFAGLYFDALRAFTAGPEACPKAWAPLVEARANRHIAPIQFALAGMNAHINRDLPVAVVRTCEALKLDLPGADREHADYEAVNGLLAATEQKVKRQFATGFAGELDAALRAVIGKADDRIAMWNVALARDAAWTQAEALWELRRIPPLASRYLATLDRVVGFAGRGLLIPLL